MKLDILHTNDIHSNISQLSKASAYIKNARNNSEALLLIDAGDMITGDFQFKFNEGMAERHINNYLKYDAVTVGNHDFDLGLDFLKNHMNEIEASYVLSNVFDKDALIGDYSPTLIKEIQGVKIGFVSFILPQIVNELKDEEYFDYLPANDYQRIVDGLKKQGTDIVIALNHQGYKEDVEFAKQVAGVDLIVSSHSHTVLDQPDKVNNTLIVQTGCFAANIGHLIFDVAQDEIRLLDYQLVPLVGLKEVDFKLQSEIDKFLEKANYHAREIYGSCAHRLEGRRDYMVSQSTDLGSLICDSYIDFARDLGYAPDFSFVNARGLRQSIEAGNITYRELYNVMPFEKELFVSNIKGADLISALDNDVALQTSNLKVIKSADGARKIFDKDIHHPIEPEKVYQIVSLTYLYEHPAFASLQKGELLASGIGKDTDAVSSYIKKLGNNFSYASNGMVEAAPI